MDNQTVRLKKGRESSLARRHPWVFSGAVAQALSGAGPGETVEVLAHDGRWLARGAWSPASQIRVRVWTFDPEEAVDEAFFRRRLAAALALRQQAATAGPGEARRLVHAESDGLPGVVVDRYGPWLVGQFLSAGAERWKAVLVREALALTRAQGFYERSDAEGRDREGLEPATGPLAGDEPPDLVGFEEDGVRFLANLRRGHKTGFYLDQRENRAALRAFAPGAEVLNAFCYSGGFGVVAAASGAAHVVQLDSSAEALALARQNAGENGLPEERFEYAEGNAFEVLRRFRDAGRLFDLVVLDPPRFAASAAQVERAARGYKDVNLLGMKLLRPGGALFTFSCSGHMVLGLFQKIVADAALDAGREARIVRFLTQGADHPVALAFPEGLYLKGLVVRVD